MKRLLKAVGTTAKLVLGVTFEYAKQIVQEQEETPLSGQQFFLEKQPQKK